MKHDLVKIATLHGRHSKLDFMLKQKDKTAISAHVAKHIIPFCHKTTSTLLHLFLNFY